MGKTDKRATVVAAAASVVIAGVYYVGLKHLVANANNEACCDTCEAKK